MFYPFGMNEDDRPVKVPAVHVLGQPVDALGVSELEQLLQALEQEKKRVESVLSQRRVQQSAADALFRF